ncbi:MAG: hypothetical protein QM774_06700 [Gordonia sp. (in: high G+C Gram-positive bacteria)]|uniref:hypothetical protein n=1 Tax=Gordonia sp. (in: high G+C Gram-positive bacteria) TaxID=84139 RepID=UPI0039E50033
MSSQSKSKNKKKNRQQSTPKPLPLAPALFPELNATFYTADPAAFLRMRIESLSLMALSTEELAPLLATSRRIGSFSMAPSGPPDDDQRRRYIAAEAVMILHHGAEMLLRLYFAHLEKTDCPWFGMASSTNFAEFKDKVAKATFDDADVAMVFLGGTDPRDAAIKATDEEFADAVSAIKLLLGHSAERFLGEAFLYNAAKHGLTTVQVDNSKMEFVQGDQTIPLHDGDMLTYLHGPASPSAPKDGPRNHLSMTGSMPDQDLAVATMIYHAIADLWQVARRRYTGQSGQLVLFTRASVEACIYGPIVSSNNIVRTVVTELTKQRPDGSLTGIDLQLRMNEVPDGWHADEDMAIPRTIDLPVRQRDKKVLINPSNKWLLPISPKGSSRV